jgi:hypothetical protein
MEKITEAMVQSGDVYVEVYPMVHIEGGARLIEGRHEKPDFWDVALRPDDWDDNNGTCYGEWEDLTRPEAEKKVAELESQHPGIAVNWVNDDA